MGPIGLPEMMAIFTIALLLFGPKKLPELGRTLGKALSEFRRAKNELKSTFETHLQELERETRIDTQPKYLSSDTDYSNSSYQYPYENNHYEGGSYSSSSASEPISSGTEQAALPAADVTTTPAPVLEAAAPVEGTVARQNGTQSAPVAATVHEGVPTSGEHPE